ncbi:MAG: hypothetical protein GY811_29315 [Myxococcales bacterium]|nr:hypothetical protein [Myxococcales bacterium]
MTPTSLAEIDSAEARMDEAFRDLQFARENGALLVDTAPTGRMPAVQEAETQVRLHSGKSFRESKASAKPNRKKRDSVRATSSDDSLSGL